MAEEDDYINEREDQQSIHDQNWQDGSGSNNPPPKDDGISPPNDAMPSTENIPKLSKKERKTRDNWRSSSKMKKGLRKILPKGNKESDSDTGRIDLNSIREQATGNEADNPLQALILNFYTEIQAMSDGDLTKEIEQGLAAFTKGGSKVQAGVDASSKVSGTAKGASGLASGIDTASKAAKSSKAVTGSVAGGITALKDGVMAIKHIYDAYKDATNGEGNTSEDKVVAGLHVVKELISSAHGTITTLKSILDLFQQSTGGLAAAIPGLGIALNAVTIAIDVYDLMKAKTSDAFIQKELKNNKWEGTLGKKKKQHWWNRKKSISAKDKRKAQDQYIATFEEEVARMTKKEKALLEEQNTAKGDDDKLAVVDQKLKNTQSALALAKKELASLKENQALTNLSEINKDRMKNAGFHIGTQLTGLVGNVLALVPEPNAQLAGVALRAAASGAVLFKKVGGIIVQKMRDHADANPESSMNKLVDSSRSSAKEMVRKKESVRYIFNQIKTSDLSDGRSVNALNNYIDATGASPRKIGQTHKDGGVEKAVQALVEAQGKT